MKPGWSCQSKVNGYRKCRWETMKGGDVLNPIIASMIHPGYRVRICSVCGYAMSERRPRKVYLRKTATESEA